VNLRAGALRCLRWWALALALTGLGGCASLQIGLGSGQKLDPWENWNRKVFTFNETLDQAVLTPVATFYSKVVPRRVRQGVDNVFANPLDAWSAVNNFLQFKGEAGWQDVMRFGTNTLLGLGGLLDIATEMGMQRQGEDFGKTLAHWGVGAGAYIVWPLLGPSTVRESFAIPLDRVASPVSVFGDGNSKTAVALLQVVNLRAGLLGASRVLEDIALDKYTFVRDAYLQRRDSLIFDDDEIEGSDSYESAPAPASVMPLLLNTN